MDNEYLLSTSFVESYDEMGKRYYQAVVQDLFNRKKIVVRHLWEDLNETLRFGWIMIALKEQAYARFDQGVVNGFDENGELHPPDWKAPEPYVGLDSLIKSNTGKR